MARKRPEDEELNPIHRENISGELEHASGQSEEFDAALVSGADGQEADPASEAELVRQAEAAAPRGIAPVTTAPVKRSAITRFPVFLKASWAELQRVQWPDRRQVAQATAVVLGFVVIAGSYLGLADAAAQKFVDFIL